MKFNKIKKENVSNQKGFTLVETMVAIFILLISTTGPLTFTQSGLRSSFLARDQVIAFYLAQDAIETIKNMRDNGGLDTANNDNWLRDLGACRPDGGQKKCNLDINDTTECIGLICPALYYNSDTKQFVLNSNPPHTSVSKYTRTIYLDEIVDDNELEIVVEVSWESNFFGEKRIVAHENIYNWVYRY